MYFTYLDQQDKPVSCHVQTLVFYINNWKDCLKYSRDFTYFWGYSSEKKKKNTLPSCKENSQETIKVVIKYEVVIRVMKKNEAI